MVWLISIIRDDLSEIIKWFEKHNPMTEECFYEAVSIRDDLPELAILVSRFLNKYNFWYSKDK